MYEELFSLECKGQVLVLLEKLMAEMKVLTFEESGEVLDGLEFVQSVGATALWRFNSKLDPVVESFVRESIDWMSLEKEKGCIY